MICYICHREAVGQCKDCGRFYCPDHGDIHCVKCRGGSLSKPIAISDLEEPARETAGAVCYECKGPATGACVFCGKFYCSKHGNRETDFWVQRPGVCGKFYCSKHGNRETDFWVQRPGVCGTCRTLATTRGKVGCSLAALFLLVVLLLFVFARSGCSGEPETFVAPIPISPDPVMQPGHPPIKWVPLPQQR